MPLLNNARQIRSEDFEQELQQAMSQLAFVLNPFIQEVVDLANGRIDFENLVLNIKTIDITVDGSGNIVGTQNINTEKTGIRGLQVISAFNLTNAANYPTSQPFISYTPQGGSIIQVNNITGLVPGDQYRITFLVF